MRKHLKAIICIGEPALVLMDVSTEFDLQSAWRLQLREGDVRLDYAH